jgi:hypothetical protein
MRLVEIAPSFVKGEMGTLMTILTHLKSKMGQGTKVPMAAVSNLMSNVGYSLTYDDFKQMFDSNPELKKIVSNFNQQEITIGDDNADLPTDNSVDGEKKVDQLAKSAAKNINKS